MLNIGSLPTSTWCKDTFSVKNWYSLLSLNHASGALPSFSTEELENTKDPAFFFCLDFYSRHLLQKIYQFLAAEFFVNELFLTHSYHLKSICHLSCH
ncbi:hypothetical protein SLEP1_g32386 [Rubroshorea leprosula]|uniref:Maturase K n=1 Tax=Rubroshorea leprosula TaxID=152421 RepID=A0AAV5KD42_9ROSI|nr:hypothetical protein SLEP1_g32386 [Rubroshorea leprosula]